VSQNTAALGSYTLVLCQDSSVGIVTVIHTGGSRNRESIFCKASTCGKPKIVGQYFLAVIYPTISRTVCLSLMRKSVVSYCIEITSAVHISTLQYEHDVLYSLSSKTESGGRGT